LEIKAFRLALAKINDGFREAMVAAYSLAGTDPVMEERHAWLVKFFMELHSEGILDLPELQREPVNETPEQRRERERRREPLVAAILDLAAAADYAVEAGLPHAEQDRALADDLWCRLSEDDYEIPESPGHLDHP
jgi:hypothetical protein